MKKITVMFNVGLTFLVFFKLLGKQLFMENTVSWFDYLYDMSPAIACGSVFFMGIILMILSMYSINQFWKRLVTSVFDVREINYTETYAIILIVALI